MTNKLLIAGGIAAAAVVGYFVFLRKKDEPTLAEKVAAAREQFEATTKATLYGTTYGGKEDPDLSESPPDERAFAGSTDKTASYDTTTADARATVQKYLSPTLSSLTIF